MIVALRHIERFIERIAIFANAIGTLVVLGLVVVVNYDIVAREFYGKPFHGAVELVQFSMVLIVFLQLPDVVRVNRLTRSDGFLSIANKRWPSLATYLNRFIHLTACIFMLLVAIAIWPEFLDMWDTKDYFGVPGVFTAPWWPVKLVIFLSASLCFLLFLLKFLLPSAALKANSAESSARVDIT